MQKRGPTCDARDEEATLPEGSRLCLGALGRDDRGLVEDVFAGLGPESRRRRFHGPKPRLREGDVERLLAVEPARHEALVAVDPESGRAVASTRFVRDARDPTTAELAFEVVDAWHGRGVATLLLHRLAQRARSLGIERFRADVLAENEPARAALRRLGRARRPRLEGSALEIVVEL